MNSGETDVRVQIPAQAWLTSQIVMNIDSTLKSYPEISLREYVDAQKAKTNLGSENPEFPIYNHGYLLMMAYAFLVVPKESIEKNAIIIISPTVSCLISKIKITTNKIINKLGTEDNIVRHIRNSISHANFFIKIDSNTIIFNDIFNDKITFNGEMGIRDFIILLKEYFKAYYEIYHQKHIAY